MVDWSPIAKVYDPLKAGSIDGTDVEPHDRAVWRAMGARYKPNKGVVGDPLLTLFVARLNPLTTEDKLHQVFSKYGDIRQLRLVRDIVTGFSKRYAFVEYKEERSVVRARRDANKLVVDQHELFVDFEQERTLKGWVPRRLGGGLGGKKESGQLRFGGRDRPFRKPINLGVGLPRNEVVVVLVEEVVVEVGGESGTDKGRETGRSGTDTERLSGAEDRGGMTGTEERGTTADTETGAGTGTEDEACANCYY